MLAALLKFRDERDWEQYNTLENMAKSLVLEASEVLEIFQWKRRGEELSEAEIAHLKEEVSDVYNWLQLIAHDVGFDLDEAALQKITKNEEKYPVESSK